jgi:hypothetical protein
MIARGATLVALAAVVAACAGDKPPAAPPATVVTETHVERVVECPAELRQAPPAKPSPAKAARISANAAGADYLKAMGATIDTLLGLFGDARKACPP